MFDTPLLTISCSNDVSIPKQNQIDSFYNRINTVKSSVTLILETLDMKIEVEKRNLEDAIIGFLNDRAPQTLTDCTQMYENVFENTTFFVLSVFDIKKMYFSWIQDKIQINHFTQFIGLHFLMICLKLKTAFIDCNRRVGRHKSYYRWEGQDCVNGFFFFKNFYFYLNKELRYKELFDWMIAYETEENISELNGETKYFTAYWTKKDASFINNRFRSNMNLIIQEFAVNCMFRICLISDENYHELGLMFIYYCF